MNRKPRKDRAELRALLIREAAWKRGLARGASNHWRARNNRKLPRLVAR